jgi:8-hydroxy-5-deazaflavin:NADPH oxidoreductase
MKIAIIGAGHVGSALAGAWNRAGHEIVLGVRDPGKPDATAFTRVTVANATSQCDVIVLCLPWAAAEEIVKSLGDLGNKIIIDAMNPLGIVDGTLNLVVGHTISGAELVAQWATGGRVVKTLNQVGAEVMANASGFASRPIMFVAGDSESAKAIVANLVHDIGFAPHDAGGLHQARHLEPFAMVWINQALMRGKGRDWAFIVADRQIGVIS